MYITVKLIDLTYYGVVLKINGHDVSIEFYPNGHKYCYSVIVDQRYLSLEYRDDVKKLLKIIYRKDELTLAVLKMISIMTCRSSKPIAERILRDGLNELNVLRSLKSVYQSICVTKSVEDYRFVMKWIPSIERAFRYSRRVMEYIEKIKELETRLIVLCISS